MSKGVEPTPSFADETLNPLVISFVKVSLDDVELRLGAFGYCMRSSGSNVPEIDTAGKWKCSAPAVGYDIKDVVDAALNLASTSGHVIGPVVSSTVLHPIAALFTGVSLVTVLLPTCRHLSLDVLGYVSVWLAILLSVGALVCDVR